jgi:hypothetical protein
METFAEERRNNLFAEDDLGSDLVSGICFALCICATIIFAFIGVLSLIF